jgi:phosphopantetheine adenylyltransferase
MLRSPLVTVTVEVVTGAVHILELRTVQGKYSLKIVVSEPVRKR